MPLRLQDLWRREEVNDYYLAEQERLKNRMLSRLVHRSDMRNQQCLNIRFIKHPPVRKRPANHGRSKSTESEMDEDSTAFGDPAISPSPPPIPHSPRSYICRHWLVAAALSRRTSSPYHEIASHLTPVYRRRHYIASFTEVVY